MYLQYIYFTNLLKTLGYSYVTTCRPRRPRPSKVTKFFFAYGPDHVKQQKKNCRKMFDNMMCIDNVNIVDSPASQDGARCGT